MASIKPATKTESNKEEPLPSNNLAQNGLSKILFQTTDPVSKLSSFLETHPIPKIWVKLNQSVTIIALLIAIISFYFAYKKYNTDLAKNDEDRIAKAWDVVARAGGKRSNIGQIAALERLKAFHQSLDHVDLHDTVIMGVDLTGANLEGANFSGTTLISSRLNDCNLRNTDFKGANLIGSNLANAQLDDVNFSNASLAFSRVDISLLLTRSLKNTDLTGITLVFDDTEDGERWDAFSDTISEARNDSEIQQLLNEACADPTYRIKVDRSLSFRFPTKPCLNSTNYDEIQARYKLASPPTIANPFK